MNQYVKNARLLVIIVIVFVCATGTSGQEAEIPKQLPGQIAYLGADYNVYVVGSDVPTDSPRALTQDASETRRYQWPTWSNDGRLAYFCCEPNLRRDVPLLLQAYVSADGQGPAKLLYEAENESYTYGGWSPANCDANATCRDLAVLVSQARQPFKVEVIRDAGDLSSGRTIGTGAPFYFSWSYDGQQMLWQRNNRRLSVYNAQNGDVIDLSEQAGTFPAPALSPIDNRAVVASRGEAPGRNSTLLLIDLESRERIPLETDLQGLVAFNWSPDGQYIAYRQAVPEGFGHLNVIDAETGDTVILSSTTGVISFLWSPDSTKIAVLSPALTGGSQSAQGDRIIRLLWSVLDFETGILQPVYRFAPTAELAYYLAYFDQFSQSHQLWSPDSRYLLFGEVVLDNERENGSRLTILDTAANGAVPFHIKDAVMGVWSFN